MEICNLLGDKVASRVYLTSKLFFSINMLPSLGFRCGILDELEAQFLLINIHSILFSQFWLAVFLPRKKKSCKIGVDKICFLIAVPCSLASLFSSWGPFASLNSFSHSEFLSFFNIFTRFWVLVFLKTLGMCPPIHLSSMLIKKLAVQPNWYPPAFPPHCSGQNQPVHALISIVRLTSNRATTIS